MNKAFFALGCAGALCAAQAAAPARAPAPVMPADAGPRCTGTAAAPLRMSLQLGKSAVLRLPEAALNRSVGNPQVVQAMLVAPDLMYVVGVDVGATNMIVQGRSGVCSIIDVVVGLDLTGLKAALTQAMPDEKEIQVAVAADTVILSGSVADGAAVQHAGDIAAAFVRRPTRALAVRSEEGAAAQQQHQMQQGGAARVVNLLNVRTAQQVMLEVKVAEVSKTLLERLDASATFKFASGSWATALLANFLSGKTQGMLDARKSNGNQLTFGAGKQDALVRVLAEPTVLALSGQEGSFLAGGRVLIPVAQDNNKVTLEEKEFGVGLRFTPTVLAGGRINLRVSPEVSELSREGVGLHATGLVGSAVLPLITTRRASTTVQLYDGQSFAIGGLIRNNLVTNANGLPLLGELPILGALFRSVDYQQDRTELVFVVTAHLVKSLVGEVPLPTDSVPAPTRAGILLGGLEGAAPAASATASAPASRSRAGFELK